MVVRPRPTLPPSPPGSTIGAGGLSFRVRDGTGRFPAAMAAVTLRDVHHRRVGVSDLSSGCEQESLLDRGRVARRSSKVQLCGQALGLLVPVRCTPYGASTSGLSTRWSAGGLNPSKWVGDLILKQV